MNLTNKELQHAIGCVDSHMRALGAALSQGGIAAAGQVAGALAESMALASKLQAGLTTAGAGPVLDQQIDTERA